MHVTDAGRVFQRIEQPREATVRCMLWSSIGLRRHQKYMQEHIRTSRSTLGTWCNNYTRVSKNVSVNRSNRQTLSLNGQQHARCKRSSHRKWNQREREKDLEVLVASLLASLLAGPCDGSREGFRTRTSRLWTSWILFEASFVVLWWSEWDFRARKIRAHSRILRLEREVLRPENLVQSQLCA